VIQSIHIENYRGIRTGQLSDLPRIAVLTGPNGCGKSSILEAIELGSGMDGHPSQIVTRWEFIATPTRWLMSRGADGAFKIGITWKDGASFRCRFDVRASQLSANHYEDPHGVTNTRQALFIEHRPGRLRPPLHQLFTNARIRGGAAEAITVLNEVDPSIRGLEILTEGEIPILHIAHDDRVVPAALAGDGMGSLVRLALELTQRRAGTFLIEEPEAHQHSAAILRTAQVIVAAARLDTQIFLSTHSLELIDDLMSVLKDEEVDWLAVYRLRLRQGELKVHRVAGADVNAARTAIGDDLR
jgi:hypothetical protein